MVTRRTHKGNAVDIDALINNAPVNQPAVGNMRVNARGDVLGPSGEIVQKHEDRVRAYYKDNPKSSTSKASIRGESPKPKPSVNTPAPDIVEEPDEFDAPMEPLGYNEVEQPDGNIQMVPYYKEEDKNE